MSALGTGHKVKGGGGGVGWENHVFGVCTFGSPPLNSCTKTCGPPLNWCLKNYDPPFQKAERYQRSIFLLPNNYVLQYSIAIQIVQLKFRASFKDV